MATGAVVTFGADETGAGHEKRLNAAFKNLVLLVFQESYKRTPVPSVYSINYKRKKKILPKIKQA